MVFSALLGAASASRPKPSPASSSSSVLSNTSALARDAAEHIFDETQLRPAAEPSPDLRDLNNSLEALAAVFPDLQIEVFREMLSHFDGESRLAVVANALLKSGTGWVKGRWRVAEKDGAGTSGDASGRLPDPQRRVLVPEAEVFRSTEYKKAVKTLAWREFKGLPRSTVNAVLAEQNYSYLEARQTLVGLSSKSWRFAVSSMFLRRKPVASSESDKHHPLIVWKSSGQGSIVPSLKATGNAELDRELFNALISPLKAEARTRQEVDDRTLATTLNMQEAEAADATYECACCFTDATFEELTTCNRDGHLICFRCVRFSISEAVFGQGWHRSIDKDKGALRCPAVDTDECTGCIPPDHMHRTMAEEKKGAEILHKLEQRLAEHSLLAAGSSLPLVRCPFCNYAEVDDLYVPEDAPRLRLRADSVPAALFLLLCLGTVPFLLPLFLFSSFVALLVCSRYTLGDYFTSQLSAALTRLRRRRHGLKFACRSPACRRVSCLACAKAWVDVHVCHESALVALRTAVETAMSLAVKRVCPRCHTSFVKTAGCNKLTCPCGYKMCYVCRRDIGGAAGADAGYRHFCEHFRPDADPARCTECSKCNLWEAEDTEAVLRAARGEAERRWREAEGRELGGAERALLEKSVAAQSGRVTLRSLRAFVARGRLPSVPEVFDFIVDNVIA